MSSFDTLILTRVLTQKPMEKTGVSPVEWSVCQKRPFLVLSLCPTSDRMYLLAFLFSTTICCGYPQYRTGATPLYRIRGAHLYSGYWIGVSENLPSRHL